MSRKNSKVSIYAVAKAAGVSYGTVSRALYNRCDVNPETRDRVLAVARRLFPAIYVDHAVGSRLVVAHLATQNRTRIAFVSGDDDSVAANERLRGYREGLQQAGLPLDTGRIQSGGFTIDGGMAATEQLLAVSPSQRPNAIFYASDAMALAGMRTLHAANIRIPADIAVAGFGNISFAAICELPLTTVRMSKSQIGHTAAQLLIQMTEKPEERPDDVVVDVELVVRASSNSVL